MIFTAGPLARSQVTSQMFKDMGALNLAPTVVGEVRVTGIRCRITNETMFVLTSLWAMVASILLSKKVPTDKTVLATITPINLDLFPRPAMITVVKNMTDNLQTKLLALGFSMQSQGTYKFYKGAGTDQAIRDLTELGAEVDSHAPRNTTSMHGIMALGVINRVLHAAYSVLLKPSTPNALRLTTSLRLQTMPSPTRILLIRFQHTVNSSLTSKDSSSRMTVSP